MADDEKEKYYTVTIPVGAILTFKRVKAKGTKNAIAKALEVPWKLKVDGKNVELHDVLPSPNLAVAVVED